MQTSEDASPVVAKQMHQQVKIEQVIVPPYSVSVRSNLEYSEFRCYILERTLLDWNVFKRTQQNNIEPTRKNL